MTTRHGVTVTNDTWSCTCGAGEPVDSRLVGFDRERKHLVEEARRALDELTSDQLAQALTETAEATRHGRLATRVLTADPYWPRALASRTPRFRYLIADYEKGELTVSVRWHQLADEFGILTLGHGATHRDVLALALTLADNPMELDFHRLARALEPEAAQVVAQAITELLTRTRA